MSIYIILVLVFVLVLVLVILILLHFDSVLVLVIVTKISLFIGLKRWQFFVVPSTFLALQVQSVVFVSASLWSVQFDHFLVFFLLLLLSVSPFPVICKSVGTCPRALDGVSVTFVLQFHTRKHYKQPFNLNT